MTTVIRCGLKLWHAPIDASSIQIDVNAVADGEMPAGPISMLDVGVVTQYDLKRVEEAGLMTIFAWRAGGDEVSSRCFSMLHRCCTA